MASISDCTTHAISWTQKIKGQAAKNSLSKNINLVQLGISCMSFSTVLFSVLQIWEAQHTRKGLPQIPIPCLANTTPDSVHLRSDKLGNDSMQLQLILESIETLSSQIILLGTKLNSCCQVSKANPIQHLASLEVPQKSIIFFWPTAFNILALLVWVAGAAIFAQGLSRFSVANLSKVLTWGLGAGSIGLSLAGLSTALSKRNLDMGYLYVVMAITPLYVAMTIALSFVNIDEEGKEE